jgi:hypothetical protein
MFNCKALIARKSRTTALLLMFFTSPLLADDAATTSATPTAPAATPPYTLFNPVPADQLRSMDTDRPNVTNTPHTVDAGHLQIETGFIDYAYDRSRFDGDTIRSNDLGFAESDFRLGVLSNLELNAVIDPYQLDQQRDEKTRRSVNADGFGDTIAGAKFNLWGDE